MLSFPPGIQVFLATEPVDMRKSFDGLSAVVESVFERSVLDGHLFLFLNRRRDRMKMLWWDRDGLAILAKRLESGSYEMPRHAPNTKRLTLDATQLAMLLGGVSLDAPKRRRYVRPAALAG
jgi:transposase